MILYHGSNQIVDNPKVLNSDRFLDFGNGFYTTTNYSQAKNFAYKVVKRSETGKPIVNVYELDDAAVTKFNLMQFESSDESWLDFVSNCRNGKDNSQCDLVIGPVADDNIYQTFILYSGGILTKEQTIEALKVKKLFNQYVFKNDSALKALRFVKGDEV